jgi:hypothetical protein
MRKLIVQEWIVMIDPLLLGGGKRFFRDDGVLRPVTLVESQATTGAVLATCAVATR